MNIVILAVVCVNKHARVVRRTDFECELKTSLLFKGKLMYSLKMNIGSGNYLINRD